MGERVNPMAAIDKYRLACEGDDDAGDVVDVGPGEPRHRVTHEDHSARGRPVELNLIHKTPVII